MSQAGNCFWRVGAASVLALKLPPVNQQQADRHASGKNPIGSGMAQSLKLSLILIALAAVASAHAQQPEKAEAFTLKGSYGTLVYDGKGVRSEIGNDYEYKIAELNLRYDPDANVNKVDEIALQTITLRATQKAKVPGRRSTVLLEGKQPVTLILTVAEPSGSLKNLTFKAPKADIQKADFIGFSASDGRLLWPIIQSPN